MTSSAFFCDGCVYLNWRNGHHFRLEMSDGGGVGAFPPPSAPLHVSAAISGDLTTTKTSERRPRSPIKL